jgi:hypothetical protein
MQLDQMRTFRSHFALFVIAFLSACGGDGSASIEGLGPPRDVQVTWSANHEKIVNQAGGGYRVYYSTSPGFSVSGATFVDAPYESGPEAPTTAILPLLSSGLTYYVKVVAYSSVTFPGASTPAISAASNEFSIKIP